MALNDKMDSGQVLDEDVATLEVKPLAGVDEAIAENGQTRRAPVTPRTHKRENAFEFTKQLDATQLYLNEIGFSDRKSVV